MKTLPLTLAAALTLVLHASACGGVQQRQQGAAPQPSPTTESVVLNENGLSPEQTAFMKNLLFADEPIEKFLGHSQLDAEAEREEPWRGFILYVKHSKEGNVEEAKKDLRRALSSPAADETRMRLLAWTALRAMGERPPREAADEVQGVVCELHNEAGVGTLAAYKDGRARWFGGQGAGSFWEAPGDEEVDSLIAALLRSAAPLVKRVPAAETRAPAGVEMEHFRVSVLTLGGIHVVDVYGPDIDGKANYLAPTLMTSVRLLNALIERGKRGG